MNFITCNLMCFILDIILLMLKLVSNKIDTYLTSLWRHESYLFSVFRGILPAIFRRFSKKYEFFFILDEVVFILFLSYICIQLLRADIPSFFYGKDCFSNIKTSSKRLEYSRRFLFYIRYHTFDVKTCFQQNRYVFDVIVTSWALFVFVIVMCCHLYRVLIRIYTDCYLSKVNKQDVLWYSLCSTPSSGAILQYLLCI
jgi:hypothetical protein